ncbi:hypothetical protein FAUST_1421 [Fusarium austroamericanum]|uniref:Secreted protein CSS2 C-terminal domain-containing protein n=1 Tax=Fusarium austroamericanum TaxID=282268 RepID=A0AAN6C8Z7_FUSAU|nr:hypothetical protein FAUST_1421 [Fusarium austroamericanum]
MDTDLKALSAVYAFVLIGPGSALYNEAQKRVGYIPIITEWDGPETNLTATLGLVDAAYVSPFDTRREINVMMWAAVAGAGDSDGHHVEGYAYQATTSGHDCKTTAERKTILAAVKKCADILHANGVINGCCKFSHGGTWTGHLRLTSQPSKYPAHSVNC